MNDASVFLNRDEATAFIMARGWDAAFAARVIDRKRKFTPAELVQRIRVEAGYVK